MRGFDLRERSHIDRYLQFTGRASVRGLIYDLGTYPALVHGEGCVIGELYKISDPVSLLTLVDAIEDFRPNEPTRSQYVRLGASVSAHDRRTVTAWVYFYNRNLSDAAWIPSGDYVAHVRRCCPWQSRVFRGPRGEPDTRSFGL